MSGAKGRSGGTRAGAGRKPRKTATNGPTPLEILMGFAQDVNLSVAERTRAAGLAAQYVHAKRGEGGKKEAVQAASDAAAVGKFAPKSAPPKLVVNNG